MVAGAAGAGAGVFAAARVAVVVAVVVVATCLTSGTTGAGVDFFWTAASVFGASTFLVSSFLAGANLSRGVTGGINAGGPPSIRVFLSLVSAFSSALASFLVFLEFALSEDFVIDSLRTFGASTFPPF